MKAVVFDCETSIRNRGEHAIGDMASSPYCVSNSIVCWGVKPLGKPCAVYRILFDTPQPSFWFDDEAVLVIGHNITFDLKHLLARVGFGTLPKHIHIWDTQQVAYLLSGQTHLYPSLDELAAEIGAPLKDDRIKEYWKAGVDTTSIPWELLSEYQEHDCNVTEQVFRYQYEIVSRLPAMFNLVKVKMEDLLATMEMENNGMKFDLIKANTLLSAADRSLSILMDDAMHLGGSYFKTDFKFNPLSNEHVSLLMFGGMYNMVEDVEIVDDFGKPVFYKTGKRAGLVKTRKQTVVYSTPGMGLLPVGRRAKKSGIYSVDETTLEQYKHIPIVNTIMRIRELTKEIETYYRGYSKLVWPSGLIHPSFNHCATRTGRQSCTKPNLQNVTREE